MKKILAFSLALVAIIGAHLTLTAQAACTPHVSQFPTSLDTFLSNDCVPSAWANELEILIGVNGSVDTNSLQYRINNVSSSTTAVSGANGQVQYNNSGTFGANSNFTFSSSTGITVATATINNVTVQTGLTISGLGSSGNSCLTVNSGGVVATTTCASSAGTLGPSTSTYVAYFNGSSTVTGTSTFTVNSSTGDISVLSLGTNLYAAQFPGSDMCAKINNAYAALPIARGTIFVPRGTYHCTTNLLLNTNEKNLQFIGAGGGGFYTAGATTLIDDNSSGTFITYQNDGFSSSGFGIFNMSLVGPVGVGNIGSSAVASTYAIQLGAPGGGTFGFAMQGVQISGFGTGFYVGSNISFLNLNNVTIQKNGQDYYSPQIGGANGENMRISNSVIADCNSASGQSISAFCFDVQLSGNVQYTLQNDSFDDAQIYSNQFGGTANIWNITDIHDEDPNTGQSCYDRILTQPSAAGAQATVFNIKGGDFMEDKTSGACNEFIGYGGTLNLNGVAGDINNNVSSPMNDFAQALNGNAIISWSGLTNNGFNTGNAANTGFTNVYGTQPFSQVGLGLGTTTASFSFSVATSSFGTKVQILSNNLVDASGNKYSTSTSAMGSFATTTPFTAGFVPITSSSLALTNSQIFQNTSAFSVPVLKNSCLTSSGGTAISSLHCSLGTVTSGDFIVVTQEISKNVTSSVIDSGGNSYTTSSQVFWGSGNTYENIWYSANITGGGSFNVTSTLGTATSTFMSLAAFEYSGIATSSPLDVTSTATFTPGITGFTSGTSTTSQSNELVIGAANCNNNPGTVTAGSGFSLTATSSNVCAVTESQLLSGVTTTISASFVATTTNNYVASMATFKDAPLSVTNYIGIGTAIPSSTLHIDDGTQSSTLTIGDATHWGCLKWGTPNGYVYEYGTTTTPFVIATTSKPTFACE